MGYKSTVLKKKLTIVFVLVSVFCGFSQNRTIDSLKLYALQEEVEDTTKIRFK